MNPILIAVLVLAGIGFVASLLLVIAAKFMAVPVDERFPVIRGCLPGANCGACGYAGCDGYANALVDGSETKINKCVAGGNSVAEALAAATGQEFEEAASMVAFVHCKGDCNVTQKKSDYEGTRSCKAVRLLYGGDGTCQYGCIGYGDCAAVCPEQAINIINGVAHVNEARCVGCGLCSKTCPQHIISVIPKQWPVKVACSNMDKGAVTRKKCTAGCIGCGMCQRNCPAGAIAVVNNVAQIDYDKCTGCGKCKEVCPMKCILYAAQVQKRPTCLHV